MGSQVSSDYQPVYEEGENCFQFRMPSGAKDNIEIELACENGYTQTIILTQMHPKKNTELRKPFVRFRYRQPGTSFNDGFSYPVTLPVLKITQPLNSSSKYLDDLKKWSTKINILVIGELRAGKSSLINTIFSVYNGFYSEKAKSLNLGGTQTRCLHSYKLNENITFLDTPGLSDLKDGEKLFKEILQGRVPENVPLTLDKENGLISLEKNEQYKIDIVFYVTPAGLYNNYISETGLNTKKGISDLLKKHSNILCQHNFS
jgi:hypothetical protein